MPNKREGAVIHHTVTPQGQDLQSALTSINESHRRRGFPESESGSYIGYHYIISSKGTVAQTRQDYEVGAHTAEEQMNYKRLGIALMGNFNDDILEGEQREAIIVLLAKKIQQYGWEQEDIGYHGQFKQTACPGYSIKDQFSDIIQEAFNKAHSMKAPEWFKTEGFYDRAIQAGIKGVKEEKPLDFFEHIASMFKIVDAEKKTKKPEVSVAVYKTSRKIKPLRLAQEWFESYIDITCDLHPGKFDDYGWARNTKSVGNRPTKKWLEDNINSKADIVILVIPKSKWKRKGVAGYAPSVDVINNQLILIKEGQHSISTAHEDPEAAVYIHELCHTFYQMTGQDDRTHEFDFETKDLGQALEDINWSNI